MDSEKFCAGCTGILIIVLSLGISGCAGGHTKNIQKPPRTAEAWADVDSNELMVVGKIEVFPSIQPIEQKTLDEISRNKALIVFDGELRGFLRDQWIYHERTIKVSLTDPYFVALPRTMGYFIGAIVPMRQEGSSRHRNEIRVNLPTGLRITALPQDRAIYIGTIRYFRDEFFDILRVEVIDDYGQAREQFAKKFGTAVVLQKRLLRGAKSKNETVPEPVVPRQQNTLAPDPSAKVLLS